MNRGVRERERGRREKTIVVARLMMLAGAASCGAVVVGVACRRDGLGGEEEGRSGRGEKK